MSERAVELIRKFAPLTSRTGHWDSMFLVPGKAQRWHEIQGEYRVLILADPGAGKTFEVLTRARKFREGGKKAFFIRIEDITANFENSFGLGTGDEFRAWLTSNEDAWFFLDSVDEAQLETPRALESAIRIFGERLHAARERAHIFITSRDDAWQALPDRTLVEKFLPYGAPAVTEKRDDTSRTSDPMLKVLRLQGLSEDEIRLFSSHYGVGDVPAFIQAIQRANLSTLAERPFDLKALIQKWLADRKLGTRFEVIQRMIDLQLEPLCKGSASTGIEVVKVRAAARMLAAAVMLTGKAIIRLPDGMLASDRIDPCELLPDWTTPDVNSLLRTGIFDDVVYSSVRFRHREIRELLSAQWAAELLQRNNDRARVEQLFFRDSYGEEVIVPRMRPTLTWLILLDPLIRDKALALDPRIASEGGDPSQLPLDVRRAMLTNIVDRITSGRE